MRRDYEDILRECEWEYSYAVVDNIEDMAYDAKSDLRQIFRKSEHWDENLDAIVLEAGFYRPVDKVIINDFYKTVIGYFYGNHRELPSLHSQAIDITVWTSCRGWRADCYARARVLYEFYYEQVEKFYNTYEGKVYKMFIWLHDKLYTEQFVNEDMYEYAKLIDLKGVNLGQKVSRCISKMLTKANVDVSSKEKTEFFDAINPLEIKRKVVLSLANCDFAMMSYGNSWTSCHHIDKLQNLGTDYSGYQGCYCSGTQSYALDRTSFLYYEIKPEDDVNWMTPKIRRCVFEYYDGNLIQGRVYPDDQTDKGNYNNDCYAPIRNLVQSEIASCLGFENLWAAKRNVDSDDVISKGTHYRDYTHYINPNITKIKNGEGKLGYKGIEIGHNPICVTCGREHRTQESLSCCCPIDEDYYSCANCGARHPLDDLYYDNITGNHYCEDCCTFDVVDANYIVVNTEGVSIYSSHGVFLGYAREDMIDTYVDRDEIVYNDDTEEYEIYDDHPYDEYGYYHTPSDEWEYDEDLGYYVKSEMEVE